MNTFYTDLVGLESSIFILIIIPINLKFFYIISH